MFNSFDLKLIPVILSEFKVEKILLIGLSDELLMNEIVTFCINNNCLLYVIDSKTSAVDLKNKYDISNDYIKENLKLYNDISLNVLPNLKYFNAIFINDDPNWYTVYNELNIIKKNNPKFPLVFICNNQFPHKRRDSYTNPEIIPEEYKNECLAELPIKYEIEGKIKQLFINDGLYHALEENTPKNGVLTAIENFLDENSSLSFLEYNQMAGISIIYDNSNNHYFKKNNLTNKKLEPNHDFSNLMDKFVEINFLLKHVADINMFEEDIVQVKPIKQEFDEKKNQIEYYVDKLDLYDTKLKYKDSYIDNIKSQINLKETKLQNIESKLINTEKNLEKNEKYLKTTQNRLINIEKEFLVKIDEFERIKTQIELKNKTITDMGKQMKNSEIKISELNTEITAKNNQLKSYNDKIVSLEEQNIKLKNLLNDYKSHENELKKEFEIQKKYLKNQIQNKENQLKFRSNEFSTQLSENNNTLLNQLEEKEKRYKNELTQKEKRYKNELTQKEKRYKNELTQKEIELNYAKNQTEKKNSILQQKEDLLKIKQNEIDEKENKINRLRQQKILQSSKMDSKEYCISCFKDEISNNHAEIRYLKNNTLTKKILSPLSYLYLILKSKPKEILLNLQLYKAIKDSECFDIGFYLNNNSDLIESNWYKYFPLELHYVCNGFGEERTFNKKYFNRDSKKDLLNYLSTCQK